VHCENLMTFLRLNCGIDSRVAGPVHHLDGLRRLTESAELVGLQGDRMSGSAKTPGSCSPDVLAETVLPGGTSAAGIAPNYALHHNLGDHVRGVVFAPRLLYLPMDVTVIG